MRKHLRLEERLVARPALEPRQVEGRRAERDRARGRKRRRGRVRPAAGGAVGIDAEPLEELIQHGLGVADELLVRDDFERGLGQRREPVVLERADRLQPTAEVLGVVGPHAARRRRERRLVARERRRARVAPHDDRPQIVAERRRRRAEPPDVLQVRVDDVGRVRRLAEAPDARALRDARAVRPPEVLDVVVGLVLEELEPHLRHEVAPEPVVVAVGRDGRVRAERRVHERRARPRRPDHEDVLRAAHGLGPRLGRGLFGLVRARGRRRLLARDLRQQRIVGGLAAVAPLARLRDAGERLDDGRGRGRRRRGAVALQQLRVRGSAPFRVRFRERGPGAGPVLLEVRVEERRLAQRRDRRRRRALGPRGRRVARERVLEAVERRRVAEAAA
mmetsp:Transcript_26541/g.80062  ORF Transcript_26541/g.80062 Transcript_26541/m.80062 type:complete len:390 (-) Transcript_26541:140-1309(-)